MIEQVPTWIPDIRRFPAHRFGTEIEGPPSRVIWITSEDDPKDTSGLLLARLANWTHRQPHAVWNPVTGELVQMIPSGFKNRMYPSTSAGSDCFAVLVVGKEDKPFTNEPIVNGYPLTDHFALLGVPDVWPGGPPYAGSPHIQPTRPGHYAASQVSTRHKGPGPIDIHRLPRSAMSEPLPVEVEVPEGPEISQDPDFEPESDPDEDDE